MRRMVFTFGVLGWHSAFLGEGIDLSEENGIILMVQALSTYRHQQ